MEPSQPKEDLKSQVLTRIEKESVCPRSRWVYSSQEYGVWFLWFLTVLIGALAVAVSLSVMVYHQFSFYEATHDSFWNFMMEALPYLWILIFAVMVVFAMYNLRHTKTGYRYPLWQIFGSSLVMSLALGALLHLVGAGFSLDRQMGMYAELYESQEKIEQKLWQQPSTGRLVGFYINENTTDGNEPVLIKDIEGVTWETNVTELLEEDIETLQTGDKVRVMGQLVAEQPPQFHACAVFPWMFEREHSMKELGEMKEEMRKRVGRYKKHTKDESVDENNSIMERCADMVVMRRLEPAMVK